jgi:putative membrane protein
MWHGTGAMVMGWGWMALLVLFSVVCIGVLYWLMAGGPRRGLSAMEMLDKRYAKGEISREEFERLKRESREQ